MDNHRIHRNCWYWCFIILTIPIVFADISVVSVDTIEPKISCKVTLTNNQNISTEYVLRWWVSDFDNSTYFNDTIDSGYEVKTLNINEIYETEKKMEVGYNYTNKKIYCNADVNEFKSSDQFTVLSSAESQVFTPKEDGTDPIGNVMCSEDIVYFQKCFHYDGYDCIEGCLEGYSCSSDLTCSPTNLKRCPSGKELFINKFCVPSKVALISNNIQDDYSNFSDRYFPKKPWMIPLIVFVAIILVGFIVSLRTKKIYQDEEITIH